VSAQALCSNECRSVTTSSRRRLLLACTVLLTLAIAPPARSFTLHQLLDMPIEQLLRLKITSMYLSPEQRDAT